MNQNYLFLDFDGVLNTEKYQKKLTLTGGQRADKYGPLFDPEAVDWLAEIINRTGASICLISSWGYEGEEKMRHLWKDRKMPGNLFAVCCNTPIGLNEIDLSCEDPTPEMMVGKGRDVKSFLSSVETSYNYVILDDVPDYFPEQVAHYIQVNPIIGIDENIATKAINILSYGR